jgi:sugar phosphate isomerase/epimerase
MAKLLSIGTWAYAFGPYQSNPVPFETVVKKLGELKYDGVEIGAFKPHVHPDDYPSAADRQRVRSLIKSSNLRVSGLAADFWGDKGPATDAACEMITTSIYLKRTKAVYGLGSPNIRVDTSVAGWSAQVDAKTALGIVSLWRTCSELAQGHGIRWVEFEPDFFSISCPVMRS